jgi:hypothetical protein
MEFVERSFPGEYYRPTPKLHFDRASGVLMVATSWGAPDVAETVIEKAREFLMSARSDQEITSPFERLAHLSSNANNIRIAALLANSHLYSQNNKVRLTSGVELCIVLEAEQECAWLQVGHPNIVLVRNGFGPVPLSVEIDLAMEMAATGAPALPPLPSNLLGLDTSAKYSVGSFRKNEGDQLFLLSHSSSISTLIGNYRADVSLEDLVRNLSQTADRHPFWLGKVTL